MSRPKSKDARLTLRIDMAIESDKLARFEAWFASRRKLYSKTDITLEALEKLMEEDELGGVRLPADIIELVDQYRESVDIPPERIAVIRGAIKRLLSKK